VRHTIAVAALSALLAATAFGTTALSQNRGSASAQKAISDPARPKADVDRDVHRKPAEMLAFAGIRPGTVVAELIPGGGYFTRIFVKAVQPNGHVYAFNSPPAAGRPAPGFTALANDPNYKDNLTVVLGPLDQMKAPKPVDVVWTSQNYHDLPAATRKAVNKAAFDILKPGGVYIVLDHAAVPGSGDYAMAQRPALHRIDENLVKLEVLQAGFKLAGESNVLRNKDDDHTKAVFDGSIRGDTDQFVLKFQKPR
jgi:predicted methyltransferase